LAFEQQGLCFGFRQRIGEAISKIQFGEMAAGFAEITISLACYASLRFRDRFDRDLRCLDQFIETAAGDRIFAAINYRSSFHLTYGRNARLRRTFRSALDDSGELGRFLFKAENGDQGRSVENHFGSPFSS